MKHIRLIVSSIATAAALAAASMPQAAQAQAVQAQAAQAQATQAASAHSVNWGNVSIPGGLCEVKGSIKLHDGYAAVNHGSGFRVPLAVSTAVVTHGYLGHGLPVTALEIWCSRLGSTAAGQLAEGIVVFSSPGFQPHLLGVLTAQYRPSSAGHIPYITVNHIDTAGHISVTEYFYTPSNPDCCPGGQALTVWKWTGHRFIPGRTKITAR
jgi:hypothetical protein